MKDIWTILDRKQGHVLKNQLFPTKDKAKVERNRLNQEEHKDNWKKLTHSGSARYCVVMGDLHPKNQ
jgi:hypothetical protein